VIIHGSSVVSIRTPAAGSLLSLSVQAGSSVRPGQVIGTISTGPYQLAVRAPIAGSVVGLAASPGQELLPGAPVVTVDAVSEAARAVLFVTSATDVGRLASGQRVDVAGSTYATGRVASVTPYPASAEDLVALFGTDHVPGYPARAEQTWLVNVTLDAGGPAAPALAPVDASVLVGRQHPYQLVFGGER
jgi:multidrug efflux pump subunit AcrA (membrane-fusion protein)